MCVCLNVIDYQLPITSQILLRWVVYLIEKVIWNLAITNENETKSCNTWTVGKRLCLIQHTNRINAFGNNMIWVKCSNIATDKQVTAKLPHQPRGNKDILTQHIFNSPRHCNLNSYRKSNQQTPHYQRIFLAENLKLRPEPVIPAFNNLNLHTERTYYSPSMKRVI